MQASDPSLVRLRGARAALLAGVLAFTAASGWASDGVIELNQSCAVLAGCTPTDGPGYPITLDTRGSYRLTSNLEVPDENTNGIEIASDDITIDFGGFTMIGPAFVPIATHVCSLPGTGSGIVAVAGGAGFVAQNGRVRGMGLDGINVFAQNARIERMIVERNCGDAIKIGVSGLVIDSQVRANAGWGIVVETGSRVRDSVADQNAGVGILAGAGSVVTDCVASGNGRGGIAIQSLTGATGGVAKGNSAIGNGWAIALGGISVPSGGVATGNSISANAGPGLTVGGTAGVGLNATAGNSGAEQIGGITIACNALDGAVSCP